MKSIVEVKGGFKKEVMKTRHDIGDIIFYQNGHKVLSFKITKINITKEGIFYSDGSINIKQDRCHEDKEEAVLDLMKSFINDALSKENVFERIKKSTGLKLDFSVDGGLEYLKDTAQYQVDIFAVGEIMDRK